MHEEARVVLPGVLDAAKLGSVVLVGHSDGASIALLFAAQDGGKRVRSVVAMAPHLFVEDVTVKSIAAITETWHTTELRTRLARHHGPNADGAFLGWSGAWLNPDFRAWNIEEDMKQVSVPVLAIQGEDDEYGTLAQLETLRRRAAGVVETVVLAKCGHAPHREQPEATLDAIAAFLGRGRIG
jgi:pimeloyl-ACP methyl ester carboxylesterase